MERPPAGTRRLFPGDEVEALLGPEGAGEVIARVLEEGDSADIRWLVRRYTVEALREWVRRCGGRRLSRRSRRFWEALLDVRCVEPSPVATELWLL